MRTNILKLAALTLAVLMLLLAVGCNGNGSEQSADTNDEKLVLDYTNIKASDYIKSIEYKGLQITLESEGASKQDAVWEEILSKAEMSSYPEEPVEYYFEQSKRFYMQAVDNNEDDYKKLLENRGISEDDMLDEAKMLVKKDLVFAYIVEAEKISLSDAEKQEHFDKYVDKYVETYSYKREYVVENMSELIYESMLYDKTTEYLIINNTFEIEE